MKEITIVKTWVPSNLLGVGKSCVSLQWTQIDRYFLMNFAFVCSEGQINKNLPSDRFPVHGKNDGENCSFIPYFICNPLVQCSI